MSVSPRWSAVSASRNSNSIGEVRSWLGNFGCPAPGFAASSAFLTDLAGICEQAARKSSVRTPGILRLMKKSGQGLQKNDEKTVEWRAIFSTANILGIFYAYHKWTP